VLNDLSDAVLDCAVEALVTRHVSVSMVKGRKRDPRVEQFCVQASISPITGPDLKRLGEGQLAEGTVLIITPTELLTVLTSTCRQADVLRYRDTDYQISTVKDWFDLGGFYECVGTRLTR